MAISSAAGIVTTGISHRTADLTWLSRFALDETEVRAALQRLNHRFNECLIVATCNRTEVTVVTAHPERAASSAINDIVFRTSTGPRHQLPSGFFEFHGRKAVSHLCELAAGMDSLLVGEPEILGQVRRAANIARELNTLGHVLDQAVRTAVATGRKIRDETELESEAGSLGSRLVDLAQGQIGSLAGKTVLVVGAGQAASSVLSSFADQPLGLRVVANRNTGKARTLAGRFGAHEVPIDDISTIQPAPDVIVLATPSKDRPDYVTSATVDQSSGRVAIFDLGPPLKYPEISTGTRTRIWSLADIYASQEGAQPTKTASIAVAEALIDHETSRFFSWWSGQNVTPVVKQLVEKVDQIQLREVEHALRKLGPISPSQEEVIRKLGAVIAKKFIHSPITKMVDRRDGANLARLVAELFEIEIESRSKVQSSSQPQPARTPTQGEGQ